MRGPGAPGEAAGRDEVFIGSLPDFAGALLLWGDPPGAIMAADLADRACLHALIARFQVAHACRDRQAAVSFWSQTYFSRLIIAGVAATLSHGRALPLDLDATRVSFCPETGRALAFGLNPSARRTPPDQLFAPLIDRHLAPLIALLQRHSDLSARLFWENAGWYFVWSLGEMARLRPACGPAIRQALDTPSGPQGRRHPLDEMMRSARDGLPIRRRVCCLRFRIPGFARCEGLCPLAPVVGTRVSIEDGRPTG